MKDFEALKDLWQQQPGGNEPPPMQAGKNTAGIKAALLRQQAIGAGVLAAIALLMVAVGLGWHFFKRPITYVGLAVALLVILVQLYIMLFTYFKIKKINDTVAPSLHLQQWEAYYKFRQQLARWNMPLYFITLNIAMGLYLAEAIIDHFSIAVAVLLVLYIGCMLYTYLVLEKMSLAKEEQRIQRIITYLREVLQQLE
jgi:hypothetical protein